MSSTILSHEAILSSNIDRIDTCTITSASSSLELDQLNNRIAKLEEHLLMITRNIELEAKYASLRKIVDEYNAEIERLKTWERLSK